ncbi:uncharacterized protein BXZ73DRAFT_102049 [Epithele typhae]|uniref:uncharacterized protein n=1 Tax=Epithele typhae TaxID=378194 RepID=UPI00200755F1|nr:uncharacterized protein BXZ73DRAFT_102049 [Epithele typhae]KAH9929518.1 hypothetical protein BXZ73DRAFT_102049 [Epithele typhae]
MPHLAQLLEYMPNIFNHQHRLFAYMIYIWLKKDSHLHDFIWRITRSGDRAALGLDPTATLKSLIVQATKADYPVYKLVVTPAGHYSDTMPYCDTDQPASNLEEPRQFLVGAPMSTSNDITGRATKTHLAQDVKTGRLVIVKTSWRPLVPGRTRPEHSVYLHLRDLEDENISGAFQPWCAVAMWAARSLKRPSFRTIFGRPIRTVVIGCRLHDFNELSVVMANAIMRPDRSFIGISA